MSRVRAVRLVWLLKWSNVDLGEGILKSENLRAESEKHILVKL